MGLFDKKKKVINVDGKSIELQPKPTKLPKFNFTLKPSAPKPAAPVPLQPLAAPQQAPAPAAPTPAPKPAFTAPKKPLFSFGKPSQPKQAEQKPEQRPQFVPPTPKRIIDVKPSMGLGDINIYKKQEQPAAPAARVFPAQQPEKRGMFQQRAPVPQQQARPRPQQGPQQAGAPTSWSLYLASVAARHKGLEDAMRKQGIKGTVTEFVQRMMMAAAMMSVVIGLSTAILLARLSLPLIEDVMFGILIGIAIFYVGFNSFLNFPTRKGKQSSKIIERDILFATRDMIISLRSGMPLFNAITAVSTGYGEASKEFQKIIERVQLGQPLEEAIDSTVAESRSVSFRRIMLQAAVSIKAGADVVAALQSVIDQLSQERIIELRRYGQRLNALAMFYMLFGIIMPSMGIAVATILTTFIAIFTVTPALLGGALIFIIFLQIIFLQLIRSSRPVFAM